MADDSAQNELVSTLAEDEVDFNMKKFSKKMLEKFSCGVVSTNTQEEDLPYKKKENIEAEDQGTSVDPRSPPDSPYDNVPTGKAPLQEPSKGQTESSEEENIPIKAETASKDSSETKDEANSDLDSKPETVTDNQPTNKNPLEYNFRNKVRGMFILFNVMEFKGKASMKREGTGADAQLMEETFTTLGYEVMRFDNPTAAEMRGILREIASYDHKNVDSVSVGILTHGSWDIYKRLLDENTCIADIIVAHDTDLRLEELTSIFKAGECHRSLVGKPKLFFIQACRGEKLADPTQYKEVVRIPANQVIGDNTASNSLDNTDTVAEDVVASPIGAGEPPIFPPTVTGETVTDPIIHIPNPYQTWDDRQALSLPERMPIYKDFLVAWSTPPGYFSFRNQERGSIFVQTLCRYMKIYYLHYDLLSILTMVGADVAHTYQSYAPSSRTDPKKRDIHEKKQMPWFFSRLTKDIYFRPKS